MGGGTATLLPDEEKRVVQSRAAASAPHRDTRGRTAGCVQRRSGGLQELGLDNGADFPCYLLPLGPLPSSASSFLARTVNLIFLRL